MTITKLEDSENHRNAFEISGDRHRLWVFSVRAPRQRPSCAGPTEPPGAAWACCWASLGCACVHSAPLPRLQPVSLSSREHDRADLGVLQQPAGPPRVGGPPAEADEGRLGGEPQQQASLGAVTHRKGPAPAPPADPGQESAAGPQASLQTRPHPPWAVAASQGPTCEPGLPICLRRVRTHARTRLAG